MAEIDATVGGEQANSFVTEAEAYDYLSARPHVTTWITATDSVRQACLISAALRIGQESFKGRKASSYQALVWPRSGVRDRDGRSVASDVIPAGVKYAQIELAHVLIEEDALSDSGLEGFKSLKIGSIEITPRYRLAGALPAHVQRFLSEFQGASPLQFRIVRG